MGLKKINLIAVFIFLIVSFNACSNKITKPYENEYYSKKDLDKINKIMKENRVNIDLNFKKQMLKEKKELKKIYLINNYIATFSYKSDKEIYNRNDYWATSEQFFKNGGGDCEDISISQYDLLIKYGVNENKLDFLKGKNLSGQNHLVLRYKIKENDYLILEHGYITKYKNYTSSFLIQTGIYSYSKYKILKKINNLFSYII